MGLSGSFSSRLFVVISKIYIYIHIYLLLLLLLYCITHKNETFTKVQKNSSRCLKSLRCAWAWKARAAQHLHPLIYKQLLPWLRTVPNSKYPQGSDVQGGLFIIIRLSAWSKGLQRSGRIIPHKAGTNLPSLW